jgi:exopolysaccharide biosynthesis polyprenyl glycosylphosphotransferase
MGHGRQVTTVARQIGRWRLSVTAEPRASGPNGGRAATAYDDAVATTADGSSDRSRDLKHAAGDQTSGNGANSGASNRNENGPVEMLPRESLAHAGMANVTTLLAESDERTLAILELRRRAAGAKRRGFLVARMLLLADVLGLVLAYTLAHVLVGADAIDAGELSGLGELGVFAATLPLWTLAAKVYGLYDNDDERTDHSTADDLVGVFHLVTVGTWALFVATRVAGWAQPEFWRLVAFWALATVLIAAGRGCARALCRRRITYVQNAVIVGAGDVGQFVAKKLLEHPEYGVNLLGFIDDEPKSLREELAGLRVLGRQDDLPALIRLFDVERVIFAFSRRSEPSTCELVQATKELDVQVDIVPRLYEAVGPSASIHTIEGLPLLSLPPIGPSRSSLLIKRLIDLVGACLGLLVLAPALVAVALAIKLDSRGPVFYRHERVGRDGRRLRLFKLRTMHLRSCRGERYGGSPAEDEFRSLMADEERRREFELTYKLRDDPRVTRVGKWLRSTSLDELPQLFNVLRGDMSLVGPRPITEAEIDKYGSKAGAVLAVKPGITGYWQINGRSGLDYDDRIRLDSAYVGSWSLKLDLKILAHTMRALLSRKGAF